MSPFSFRRLKKRSQFCRRPEYSIFKELWAGDSNALRRGKQSQLRRRIMSAPGHENGDTPDVPVFYAAWARNSRRNWSKFMDLPPVRV
jgi:hypothetical protein